MEREGSMKNRDWARAASYCSGFISSGTFPGGDFTGSSLAFALKSPRHTDRRISNSRTETNIKDHFHSVGD